MRTNRPTTSPCDRCGQIIGHDHRGPRNLSQQYDNGRRYDRGPHTVAYCTQQAEAREQRAAERAAYDARLAHAEAVALVARRKITLYALWIREAIAAGTITEAEGSELGSTAIRRWFFNS